MIADDLALEPSLSAAQLGAMTGAFFLAFAVVQLPLGGRGAAGAEPGADRPGHGRGADGSAENLFEAVVRDVQNRLAQAVAAASAANSWEALVRGCHAWLGAATEPAVRRILLLDAPAVLGWERWLALDAEGGGGPLREGVREIAANGDLGNVDPEALTQLLKGAMSQAALWVAHAEDRDAALANAKLALERLLVGLKRAADRPLLEQL